MDGWVRQESENTTFASFCAAIKRSASCAQSLANRIVIILRLKLSFDDYFIFVFNYMMFAERSWQQLPIFRSQVRGFCVYVCVFRWEIKSVDYETGIGDESSSNQGGFSLGSCLPPLGL